MRVKHDDLPQGYKKAIGTEAFVALALIVFFFGALAAKLGFVTLVRTFLIWPLTS